MKTAPRKSALSSPAGDRLRDVLGKPSSPSTTPAKTSPEALAAPVRSGVPGIRPWKSPAPVNASQ